MSWKDPDCPVGLEYGNHPLGGKGHSYAGGPVLDCTCKPDTDVLAEVAAERTRQDSKWGDVADRVHELPGAARAEVLHDFADIVESWGRRALNTAPSVAGVLAEEVGEALFEASQGNKARLREELIQVAAVAVFWVELIDLGGG